MSITRTNILVCGGTGCLASESEKVQRNLELILKARGYEKEAKVIKTGCFGFCEQGPIVKIEPENVFYVRVNPKDAKDIIDEHIIKGRKVERLLYKEPFEKKKIDIQENIPFYKKQLRIALRNCGLINPEDIYEYIALGGYEALGKAITKMSRDKVIETIKKSKLRGRGGGGFPTGIKWEIAKKQKNPVKFIVCNADEGDPGAFMDRSILEGDPHSVIEAMAIGGYAIGAEKGIIYIRAEYPLAIKRLKTALTQARELGLLGKNIFDSDFSFDIDIKYGAGAFVCGEETALINSCEGKRGEPNYKPPYPAEEGYWGYPTCVNNVETLSNIPPIIAKGADWFCSIGTENSKGTKVFALAGKINNVGLVEVPMGITLREIIYDIGGGIQGGKKFKAVQTGGPSGGVITENELDTPIDYDSLASIGSMMGSGGMIVMDETDNMVDIAKFYLEFTMDESCGRCTPCRIGTKRLYEMLNKITDGKATMADLDAMKQLAYMIKDSSLCGLGQTAPNPVISTMKYFWDEYLAFIKDIDTPQGEGKYKAENKTAIKS
ncbi:NADH-quinone oxidoreductase subunit NuoF [Acetivibrio saccincola]|jgi:NADH:ubiquinone oxidoreductase subunit F (NADH-binding)/(2Fe-2S) ferredoxin|uniref:NADH-quinone oxidoreductase subunit F n=1 Tax=Acetivibrio saccincola TaxID=1677857 RepID=A0A2K9EDJ4_9FIRM|nr:NADH-quinone oxidoreductase subunit NuoF [Acetivibrio saccincola]AUG58214.1 NADP-reducing hydrogenase subunit HndC [Acetivibrio saccincola]NLW26668.1 NADH-quinone oxidoreductase subunit NuoF [Acetivibrio saccincola]PQQ68091.1 NADH-quinone oxidoreductase subunit F [Acetivibrio saccincola]HOA97075.1 NADH-quinone oxidoreductase subunit NuoF [Acetivibrio saccincola]HQD27653.1 NADH-quinone oxidoreductase subunit NuoF [Acetivibrio saccincola]